MSTFLKNECNNSVFFLDYWKVLKGQNVCKIFSLGCCISARGMCKLLLLWLKRVAGRHPSLDSYFWKSKIWNNSVGRITFMYIANQCSNFYITFFFFQKTLPHPVYSLYLKNWYIKLDTELEIKCPPVKAISPHSDAHPHWKIRKQWRRRKQMKMHCHGRKVNSYFESRKAKNMKVESIL